MSAVNTIKARWTQLAAREKALVAAALAVVAAALLWWAGLAPALRTLRAADAQHLALDAQLQHMLGLQAQAQTLQAQPQQGREEALRALELTIRQRLGTAARYTISADRVSLTLAGVAPDTLAQWLTQARVNARALPSEVRLVRTSAGLWDGTLTLTLPAR